MINYFQKHWPSGPMLSISRNVRLSVCPSLCSLLRYCLNICLPPLSKLGCPIFLEIRNPWRKVMDRSGLRFEHFCLEVAVQIKCVTFLVPQKILITFLKKCVILLQDLFATNMRKSYFFHKWHITGLVKALLIEITKLVAPLDCWCNSTTLHKTFDTRVELYTNDMSCFCITLNMLPKYKVFNSNHKIPKSLMYHKIRKFWLISFLSLLHFITFFIKYLNKIYYFHNTYCMYLITFLNILHFLTSHENVLKSLIPKKIRKSVHFSSFSSLLNLIDKVFKILCTQRILHVFYNFP